MSTKTTLPQRTGPTFVLGLKAWIVAMRLRFGEALEAAVESGNKMMLGLGGLLLYVIALGVIPITAAIAVFRCRKRVAWKTVKSDWTWTGKKRQANRVGRNSTNP